MKSQLWLILPSPHVTWAEKHSRSITAQSVNKSITISCSYSGSNQTFSPGGTTGDVYLFAQRERKQTKHSNTTKSSFPVGFRPKKTNGSCGRTLKLSPLHTRPVYQSDRSIAPGGSVRSISDRWETFGPLWSVVLVSAGRTGCEKSKISLTAGQHFCCVSVCVCVCALWWTLPAGSLLFVILPVSTLVAQSSPPLRCSRFI